MTIDLTDDLRQITQAAKEFRKNARQVKTQLTEMELRTAEVQLLVRAAQCFTYAEENGSTLARDKSAELIAIAKKLETMRAEFTNGVQS